MKLWIIIGVIVIVAVIALEYILPKNQELPIEEVQSWAAVVGAVYTAVSGAEQIIESK